MSVEPNAGIKITTDDNRDVRQVSYSRPRQKVIPPLKELPEVVLSLESEKLLKLTHLVKSGSSILLSKAQFIAYEYLREVDDIYHFDISFSEEVFRTGGFITFWGGQPENENKKDDRKKVELKFKEEKEVGGGISVAFEQVINKIPIWGAGISVSISKQDMGVTGCYNALHYFKDVDCHLSGKAFVPDDQLEEYTGKLTTFLGVNSSDFKLEIGKPEPLIYQYFPDERLEDANGFYKISYEGAYIVIQDRNGIPLFSIQDVPKNFTSGVYYEVVKVLFSCHLDGIGPVSWRIFVEPESGIILHMRALFSCCTQGAVFAATPASFTPSDFKSLVPPASNPGRNVPQTLISLAGINILKAGGPAELQSNYVKLVDLLSPASVGPLAVPPYNFIYAGGTGDFAACNAYYHCDSVFRLIEGMGIDMKTYFGNTIFPVKVDPLIYANNATTCPSKCGKGIESFKFGDIGGSVSLSADIAVVLHEFGHAIQVSHTENLCFPFAHSIGDSLAAILNDPCNDALDRFETFPLISSLKGFNRRHDRDANQGWGWFGPEWDPAYNGEQILSSSLFRVYQAAGGDSSHFGEKKFASRYVTYLILKAMGLSHQFDYNKPNVLVDGLEIADLTVDNFEGHAGGAFSKVFEWSFEQQGLNHPNNKPGKIGRYKGPGSPPKVDVFIDDGRNGHYMPYLQQIDQSPGIWNRLMPDGESGHVMPKEGVVNYAYLRVANRGTEEAKEIAISWYRSLKEKPDYWEHWGDPMPLPIPPLLVIPEVIAAGAEVLIGPFPWKPEKGKNNFLFSVSSSGDMSNISGESPDKGRVFKGPMLTRRLVLLDNNIAMRNFSS